MKKRAFAIVLAMTMCASAILTGCGGSREEAAPKEEAAEETTEDTEEAETEAAETGDGIDITTESIKIGFAASSMDTNDMLWYEGVEDAVADMDNVEVNIFDANGSAETQTQQFEEMINQGYNAIIVNALDTAAISSITTEAEENGIKVVHINIGPESVHTGGVENLSYNLGVTAAEDVMDRLDAAKCVAVGPPVAMSTVALGAVGFEETLAGHDGFEFLETQAGDWTTENANELTRNLLTKYNNDIQAIFCHNDAMAMGAAQAVDAAGLTGKVLIYGVDGLQEACVYIQEGKMTGSVYCDSRQQGADAVQIALDALASGVKGSDLAETPIKASESYIIDASNVDEHLSK